MSGQWKALGTQHSTNVSRTLTFVTVIIHEDLGCQAGEGAFYPKVQYGVVLGCSVFIEVKFTSPKASHFKE